MNTLKLFSVAAVLAIFCTVGHCDQMAGILIDDHGNPIMVPVADQENPLKVTVIEPPKVSSTTITSPAQTGQLDNPWPNGYIYYTLPGVGVNLVTPWSAAILAYGYDYIGKTGLTQGYVPLATWWKVTGIVGGGLNSDNQGSPLAGGMINLVTATITKSAEFHIIITGGYDFNGKHALAVISPSVQFLK